MGELYDTAEALKQSGAGALQYMASIGSNSLSLIHNFWVTSGYHISNYIHLL